MTERAAPRAVRRWCERRGVLIHRLRVLVGVVPHDGQLPPRVSLHPIAAAAAAAAVAAAAAAAAAATPNPKRLARFASTLLALSPLFSRSSGPSAPPSLHRSVLLQPRVCYPPRHPSSRACRPCRLRRYIRTGLTRNPRGFPPTVRPAATWRDPLSRPLASRSILTPTRTRRTAATPPVTGGECTTRYDAGS